MFPKTEISNEAPERGELDAGPFFGKGGCISVDKATPFIRIKPVVWVECSACVGRMNR